MYKIKLADKRYAYFEQIGDEQVEVYSVLFDKGDSFETKNEAIKYATGINEGRDGSYTIYGNKKAVSIVEYKSVILDETIL